VDITLTPFVPYPNYHRLSLTQVRQDAFELNNIFRETVDCWTCQAPSKQSGAGWRELGS